MMRSCVCEYLETVLTISTQQTISKDKTKENVRFYTMHKIIIIFVFVIWWNILPIFNFADAYRSISNVKKDAVYTTLYVDIPTC